MLKFQVPETRLDCEDRQTLVDRLSEAQRQAIAGYEHCSFAPISCVIPINQRSAFVTVER
jgi:hypothetical protein